MEYNSLYNFLMNTILKAYKSWMKKYEKKLAPIDISQQLHLVSKELVKMGQEIEEKYKKEIKK